MKRKNAGGCFDDRDVLASLLDDKNELFRRVMLERLFEKAEDSDIFMRVCDYDLYRKGDDPARELTALITKTALDVAAQMYREGDIPGVIYSE